MAFSGSQITRQGLSGIPRALYGDFSGKTEVEVEEAAEAFSGGYFEHHPFKYRPRVRYKFRDEEEKEVAAIIEDVTERQADILQAEITTKQKAIREAAKEIEIATRINLAARGIAYKNLYDRWIKQEAKEIIEARKVFEEKARKRRRRNQEEELILLMLQ